MIHRQQEFSHGLLRGNDNNPINSIMSTKTISLDAARDLVVAALTANRTSAENARSVAAALVGAEADDIKSHGLSRVPSYAGQARSG
ncbi:MAG: Ldh family oxidoreductase, partial [Xanthobacteraceae bacterium]